ncbi:MAG: restriction endonuclease subunit S [Flavobacteriales bacterium]|nr:restriction endonuclease subunit S [Flavobacteriales bacterium]
MKQNTYLKGRIGWQNLRSDEFIDEGPYCVTGTDFANGQINWETAYHVSEERYEVDENIHLEEGDLLITKDGTIGKVARVVDMPYKATLNAGVMLIRPTTYSFHTHFMYWILVSEVFHQYNEYTKSGSTILHLYQNVFERMTFPVPSIEEQTAIANYLDEKTSKIDQLIANKGAQIERLKEIRQIEITNAVTKGLNPKAPLKPSGVEWLGDIPKHWEVKRIKEILRPNKGAIKTGPFGSDLTYEDYVDEGFKVYNQRSVLDSDFESGEIFIDQHKFESLSSCEIFPEDILITTRGTIGRCAVFPNGASRGILHPCLMRIQVNPSECSNSYLSILINHSGFFLEQVLYISNATTIEVIYSNYLKEVKLAIPPLDEQFEIVKHLEARMSKIDQLVKNIEGQIEQLKEIRKIEIYNAVTGKVKVA